MNVNISNLDTTLEHWASIDGHLNYQVSWWGRVLNTKTGRILKPGTSNGGYLIVCLSKDGQRKAHKNHKLVAREWVYNPEGKRCVDHRDGDPTNNHHENLRAATSSENNRNAKRRKDCPSEYKGVSWHKARNKWYARCVVDGKRKTLGYFTSEREAAEAYNAAALEHYKKFARLNKFND
jgi:hypothetical protein